MNSWQAPVRLPAMRTTNRVHRMFFMRRAMLLCLALLGFLAASFPAFAADEWTLKAIDGKTKLIALASIDDKGNLFAGDNQPVANLGELRELRTAKPAPPNLAPQSGVLLDLIGGGRIAGASVETKGEALALKLVGENAPEVQIPLDAIAAVRFSPAIQQPAFQEALASPSTDSDQVLALADGQLQPLKGLLSKITADAVEFEFEGQSRTLEKSKVFGVVLAKTSSATPRYHRLMLTDGSVLPAKSLRYADGNFQVQSGDASSTIPSALVQRIELMSGRLLFLSDLEPTAVLEKPLLMLPKRWQRDRAIRGGAIKLGGVEYTKGIGCQPRSLLTFKLPNGAESFLAVVGLDASTKGKGSCIFQVMGDGRLLFQRSVSGKEAPVEVAIDVSGFEELTLVVEPGDDLDLSDHADWADARLLLKANQ